MNRLAIWTLFTTTVLVFAALLIPGWLNPHKIPDAFAPYDSITPGQPVSALNDYPCNYIYGYDYWTSGQSYCQITIPDGVIRSVTAIYKNDIIETLWFHTRGMHMADVAYRWGRPDILRVSRLFYIAEWDSGIYATATTPGRFTLNSPVTFIALTRVPEISVMEPPALFVAMNNPLE